MDFFPYEGGPQTPIPPLARRVILAGLAVLAVVLGAVSVLPGSASGGVPANAKAGSDQARPPARR